MQTLLEFMNRDRLKKYKAKPEYHYFPKERDELRRLIVKLIKERGYNADLNDIDVSQIVDMSYVFADRPINGGLFLYKFNGDISQWDVRNVRTMTRMFYGSHFNGDIEDWQVDDLVDTEWMFANSNFDGNLNKWNPKKLRYWVFMFENCPVREHLPKWFPGRR